MHTAATQIYRVARSLGAIARPRVYQATIAGADPGVAEVRFAAGDGPAAVCLIGIEDDAADVAAQADTTAKITADGRDVFQSAVEALQVINTGDGGASVHPVAGLAPVWVSDGGRLSVSLSPPATMAGLRLLFHVMHVADVEVSRRLRADPALGVGELYGYGHTLTLGANARGTDSLIVRERFQAEHYAVGSNGTDDPSSVLFSVGGWRMFDGVTTMDGLDDHPAPSHIGRQPMDVERGAVSALDVTAGAAGDTYKMTVLGRRFYR